MNSTTKIKHEYCEMIEDLVDTLLEINEKLPSNMVEFSLQNVENHIDIMCNCLRCDDICGFNRHYEISYNLVSNLERQYG